MSSSSSESEYDPREALEEIDSDLTNLENVLQPLLDGSSGTWNDVLATLGNMEQAKMGMIVAYGVCDLIWIFLRLKGIDPSSHPVMKELDRIKTYYIKVRDAENPPKKANKVDVAAAGRFIAAAIPKSQRLNLNNNDNTGTTQEETTSVADEGAESSRANTPSAAPAVEESQEVGKHSRFKIAHDMVPEKLENDGQKQEIEVVQGAEAPTTSKRKGKRVAAEDFLDSSPASPAGSEGMKKAKTGVAKSGATAIAATTAVAGGEISKHAAAGKARKARKSTGSKRSL